MYLGYFIPLGMDPFGLVEVLTLIMNPDGDSPSPYREYYLNGTVIEYDEEGNYSIIRGPDKQIPAVKFPGVDSWWNRWHYSDRYERNEPPEGKVETYNTIMVDPQWTKQPEAMSVFHDNGEGEPEEKYVHEDGREYVFDGDTKELITDPKYIGTWNYVNTPIPPHDQEDEGLWLSTIEYLWQYLQWSAAGLGHGATDVLPYLIGGNDGCSEEEESE
jgi:hypothetical protein